MVNLTRMGIILTFDSAGMANVVDVLWRIFRHDASGKYARNEESCERGAAEQYTMIFANGRCVESAIRQTWNISCVLTPLNAARAVTAAIAYALRRAWRGGEPKD